MTILMNTMTGDGGMVEKRPTQNKDTLIGRMTDGDMSDLLVLRNKSPQWNDGKQDSSNGTMINPAELARASTCVLTDLSLCTRYQFLRPEFRWPSVSGLRQELPDRSR